MAGNNNGREQSNSRCLCREFIHVTEAAALAAGHWMGQGDAEGASRAATQPMYDAFATIPIDGTVVLSAADEADGVLPKGERLGAGGPLFDLAVDPLEGAVCVANGQGGAMSVLAVGEPGGLMSVPEMYMQKLAVRARAADRIDIEAPVGANLRVIAEAHARAISEITVIILDRPRHKDLVEEVRKAGARIKLIADGDISASIAAAIQGTGDHAYIGIGGAKEGIMTAAALRCLGGEIQAKFWPLSRKEVQSARDLGIDDIEARLTTTDMAKGEMIFIATGVTSGEFLKGVDYFHDGARTQTMVMCTRCSNVRVVDTTHYFSAERRELRL